LDPQRDQKRLQIGVHRTTAPVIQSTIFQDTCLPQVSGGTHSRSGHSPREGCCGAASAAILARLLQSYIHCDQEGLGQAPASHQSESSQPVVSEKELQNGNTNLHLHSLTPGRLDGLHRPHGRLSPCSYASVDVALSPIHLSRESIRVSSPALRTITSSVRLHTHHVHRVSDSTQEASPSILIPGRFPHEKRVQTPPPVSDPDPHGDFRLPGVHSECDQVFADSISDIHLPRSSLRSGARYRTDPRRPLGEDLQTDSGSSFARNQSGQRLVRRHRSLDFSPELRDTRQTTRSSFAVSAEQSLETQNRLVGSHSHVSRLPRPAPVVASEGSCPPGSLYPSIRTDDSDVHRRFDDGMGSPRRRSPHVRFLDEVRTIRPQQHLGDEGCLIGIPPSDSSAVRPEYPVIHGQLDGSCLHKQTGRDALPLPVSSCRRTSPVPSSSRIVHQGKAHPGCEERTCGPIIQIGSDSIHGVDSTPESRGQVVRPVGPPSSRPLCDDLHDETPPLRVPVSGPEGRGRGRPRHGLAHVGSLRLPSNSANPESSRQDKGLHSENTPHRSRLANQDLVSPAAGPSRGPSLGTAPLGRPPEAAARECLQPEHRHAPPSRVALIRDHLRQSGFSETAASRISQRNRSSTKSVYQSRWKAFVTWCGDRELDPFKISIPSLADFLLDLFDRNFSVGSIKGYRSAIASTLRHFGRDIGTNRDIIDLLSSMTIDRPRPSRSMPTWNLALVLQTLLRKPYEPIGKAEIKFLTLKTVFLVALASGSRVSEIAALDANSIHFGKEYSEVTISPGIRFLPKNLTPEEAQGKLRSINIKALTQVLSDKRDDDRLLCPVRALKAYLAIITPLRKGRSRLFLATRAPHQEVSKLTISCWIKKTIRLAYQSSSDEDRAIAGVRAHDVRGFAASWAFTNAVPLLDVLKSGTWRSHSVFSDYYLKDLTTIHDDMLSLGTLSVAQQRVNPLC
jgi:integrase